MSRILGKCLREKGSPPDWAPLPASTIAVPGLSVLCVGDHIRSCWKLTSSVSKSERARLKEDKERRERPREGRKEGRRTKMSQEGKRGEMRKRRGRERSGSPVPGVVSCELTDLHFFGTGRDALHRVASHPRCLGCPENEC